MSSSAANMVSAAQMPGRRTQARTFATAYLVVVVPLALLSLPLLAHRSEDRAVLTFSARYATFLAIAAFVVAALPAIVAVVCAWLRSVAPAFAFVVALVTLVAGCLALEVALTARLRLEDSFAEYRAWGHKRSLLFAFEAEPNRRWTNAGATYTTDRFGFRTHVRGPWEDVPGPRIFTLGESAVFGYGLNDDETWAHLLEGHLRTKRGDATLNVVNAGNNGHTSLQTLFRFYARVLPHDPTHVILYLGPNDVYGGGPDRLLISEEILFNGSVAQFWAAETRGQNLYVRSLVFYVVQQRVPALARVMRSAVVAEPVYAPETPQDTQRRLDIVASGYVENIRTLCVIAKSKGITPVLVTFMQAMEYQPAPLLRYENTLLRALAVEQGVPLIDVAAAFEPVADKASYFFDDHYHPNPKGAAFIADVVAEHWP